MPNSTRSSTALSAPRPPNSPSNRLSKVIAKSLVAMIVIAATMMIEIGNAKSVAAGWKIYSTSINALSLSCPVGSDLPMDA